MTRFFIIVLDGVGAGGAPDACEYGDEGANTLGNLARGEGRFWAWCYARRGALCVAVI